MNNYYAASSNNSQDLPNGYDEENQKQGIIDIENEYLILKGVQEFTTNKIRKLIYLTRHKIHRLNQLIWIIMFVKNKHIDTNKYNQKYLNDKINEIEDYLIYSMEPVNLTQYTYQLTERVIDINRIIKETKLIF
jgi:hypothetical protein